jgi:hypothetical protein
MGTLGMTKANCKAFETLCETEISKVCGPAKEWNGNGLEWSFQYGETGTVTIHLIRDSFDQGRVYRASFLACRHHDDSYYEGGYMKRGLSLPHPFTTPSGKCNLHPGDNDSLAQMRRDLAHHLYSIAKTGSPEKQAFGAIEFEVVS